MMARAKETKRFFSIRKRLEIRTWVRRVRYDDYKPGYLGQ